jgi:hypothetical protein
MPWGDFYDIYQAAFRLRWETHTDFNKGTYTATEVSGTNNAAIVQPSDATDIDDNIPYTTAGNYTLSDSGKLEVADGDARLKSLSGTSNTWPFTTAGNYTYDSAKIEVTGDIAKLKANPGREIQYHMNESSGTTVSDVSGNSRDGTTQNMEDGDWVVAKLNNGLRFDGVDEYVDTNWSHGWERTQAFTFEAWIKTSTTGAYQVILSNRATPGGQARAHDLFVNNNNKIRLYVFGNNLNRLGVESSSTVTDGSWHHIVATYDGTSAPSGCHIYIDNVDESLTTVYNTLASTTVLAANTIIGKFQNGGSYFTGDIDEVVIYAVELTSAQVSSRYNSGSGTEEEGYDQNDPTIVPNTGFAFTTNLSAFTETATKGGSSEIKYHCSSDDGTTWKYWTGAAWVVTDDSYTQANTATDVNTNIGTLAASGTFTFRALLHSSDGIDNPELDKIDVTEPVTFSTTDNLYIDTKAASQIAPSQINAWSTLTITNSKPANTDIRVLLSNDGQVSWLTYTGGSWQAPASATTRTDATSITDAQTNAGSLPTGSGTLDVRLFLYTSVSSTRPTVSNINVTGDAGYELSGSWESNQYNSFYPELDWNQVTWTSTEPSGTSLTIKCRAADTTGELDAESYTTVTADGDDANVTGQYIQFKVEFSGTVSDRATLDTIAVDSITPIRAIYTP